MTPDADLWTLALDPAYRAVLEAHGLPTQLAARRGTLRELCARHAIDLGAVLDDLLRAEREASLHDLTWAQELDR